MFTGSGVKLAALAPEGVMGLEGSLIHLHDPAGHCHPHLWQVVISEALVLKLEASPILNEWQAVKRQG